MHKSFLPQKNVSMARYNVFRLFSKKKPRGIVIALASAASLCENCQNGNPYQ